VSLSVCVCVIVFLCLCLSVYVAVARIKIQVDPVGLEEHRISREDVGWGQSSAKQGRELAVKEAVTDAMKRAFRTFGNAFGNSLYDKKNPLHDGKADTHVEKMNSDDAGNLLQQLSHDLSDCKTVEEWTSICRRYAPDITRLPEEGQRKARGMAKEKKPKA